MQTLETALSQNTKTEHERKVQFYVTLAIKKIEKLYASEINTDFETFSSKASYI